MSNFKNIYYLLISKKRSGGGLYGRYISNLTEIDTHYLLKKDSNNKFIKLFKYLFNLSRFQKNRTTNDTIIHLADSCFFINKRDKSILLVHHYDPISKNILIRLFQTFLQWNIVRNRDKIDSLIVVSEYWKSYFKKLGFTNITVIYNPFEISLYRQRSLEEKNSFIKKYKLEGKPIVYLGNPQEEKGTDRSHNALKGLDVHFVTTGIEKIKLPVKHLELSFYDYITLLQVSDVSVLMSQFKEGWNRVAHESILCETVVVGSGKGGMGELLDKSNQYICNDWDRLYGIVKEILEHKRTISQEALSYVKAFDIERFETSWRSVL